MVMGINLLCNKFEKVKIRKDERENFFYRWGVLLVVGIREGRGRDWGLMWLRNVKIEYVGMALVVLILGNWNSYK